MLYICYFKTICYLQAAVAGSRMGAALAHTACANHRVMDGYLPLKTQSMRRIILSHPYYTELGIPFTGVYIYFEMNISVSSRVIFHYLPLKTQSMHRIILSHPYYTNLTSHSQGCIFILK